MTACDTDTISTAVQIVQAVEDGHDVRGITMWTLIDNFEWACETFLHFFLFHSLHLNLPRTFLAS